MRKSSEHPEKVLRKFWKSLEKVQRKSWESLKKVFRKSWENLEKVLRKSSNRPEKVQRKSWESLGKVLRKAWHFFIFFRKSCKSLENVLRKAWESPIQKFLRKFSWCPKKVHNKSSEGPQNGSLESPWKLSQRPQNYQKLIKQTFRKSQEGL